jgi:hypothetical protein
MKKKYLRYIYMYIHLSIYLSTSVPVYTVSIYIRGREMTLESAGGGTGIVEACHFF